MAWYIPRFPLGLPLAFVIQSLAVFCVALSPAVMDARATARRAQCSCILSMPGTRGWEDVVYLDRDWKVTRVECDRHWSVPAKFPFLVATFYIEGSEPEPVAQSLIPETTLLDAKYRLDRYKQTDWFRGIRDPIPLFKDSANESTGHGLFSRGC